MSEDETMQKKTSKVKRSAVNAETESEPEITLERVSLEALPSDLPRTLPTAHIAKESLPVHSASEALIEDLSKNPSSAIQLVQMLRRITKGWEPIGSNGSPITETPVPPGKNPKDFIKATASSPVHVSGFRLCSIFGDEIAMITKDSPKWRVTILGEYQVDTPFVQHSSRAEFNAKSFAESKLRDLGYIIG